MDPSRRFFLVRHAQAQLAPGQDEDDRFSMANSALSPAGEAQARRASERIGNAPVDAVLASPLVRATHTAALLAAPRGLTVRSDPRFKELPIGGRTYEEKLASILALPERLAAENDPVLMDGVSYHEHVRRFDQGVRAALRQHALPVIVGHAIANRAWLCHVLGSAPEELLVVAPQEHGEVLEVTLAAEGAQVHVVGD